MKQQPPQSSTMSSAAAPASSRKAIINKSVAEGSVEGSVEGSLAVATKAYHELRENPHFEIDGLQRLTENLNHLEDLQGRVRFMMREISTLTRR